MSYEAVPEIMNEQEAKARWCTWGNRTGIMTVVENAASTSLPDLCYMSGGLMMWMEAKYLYNHKYIYAPPYQSAYAKRISHHLNEWQHHYVVFDPAGNHFKVFTAVQISKAPLEAVGNKLRYDLSTVVPIFYVSNQAEFDAYRDYLEEKHF